jgi:hypothetical protein
VQSTWDFAGELHKSEQPLGLLEGPADGDDPCNRVLLGMGSLPAQRLQANTVVLNCGDEADWGPDCQGNPSVLERAICRL